MHFFYQIICTFYSKDENIKTKNKKNKNKIKTKSY